MCSCYIMPLFAGLAQRQGAHPLGPRLTAEHLPEAIALGLQSAFTSIQEQADQLRQGQGPLAGEVGSLEASAGGEFRGTTRILV